MALVIGISVFLAVYFGALTFTGASFGAADPPGGSVPAAKPCKTVTPKVWNRYVGKLDRLTGRRHHRATRKVCKSKFRQLKRDIRQAKKDCLRRFVRTTGASYYGYNDSGGIVGACGLHLMTRRAQYSFAILGTGNVQSRCGQRFYFHRNGVTRSGIQADTGGGGGSAGGYPRTFDFWAHPSGHSLAHDLGLIGAGLGVVQYSTRNCWI